MKFEEKIKIAYKYAQKNAYRFSFDEYNRSEIVQNSILTFINGKKNIEANNIEGKAIDSWMHTIMQRERNKLTGLKHRGAKQAKMLNDIDIMSFVDDNTEDNQVVDIESNEDLLQIVSCRIVRKQLLLLYKRLPVIRYQSKHKRWRVLHWRIKGYSNTEISEFLKTTPATIAELYRLAKLDIQKIYPEYIL